jgi:hypothetical protein
VYDPDDPATSYASYAYLADTFLFDWYVYFL